MPELDDIVLVWCHNRYRPGMIKDIGKEKTLIAWADGEKEWIENERIIIPKNLEDRSWMERVLKKE